MSIGARPKKVALGIAGTAAKTFHAFCTPEGGADQYADAGRFAVKDGAIVFEAPAGSVTIFFAAERTRTGRCPEATPELLSRRGKG